MSGERHHSRSRPYNKVLKERCKMRLNMNQKRGKITYFGSRKCDARKYVAVDDERRSRLESAFKHLAVQLACQRHITKCVSRATYTLSHRFAEKRR